MSDAKTGAPATVAAFSAAVMGHPGVLLVDDQPARLLTYESILSGLPVHCVRALSGLEALERLLKEDFAVILLDVNMPGMDGFELARLIRGRPRLERTPIIFVTGAHITELDQLQGYEVGAIDYLPLPVVPEILRSKVAVLVELDHRRGDLQEANRQLQQTRQDLELEHSRTLAQKSAQWRALFENPFQWTVVLQASRGSGGEVTDWVCSNANVSALRLFNRPPQELIGRTLTEVCPHEAVQLHQYSTRVLTDGQAFRFELHSSDRAFSVMISPIDAESVIATGLEITEFKRTEGMLRDSERRHRTLLEDAPVAVAHNSMDGRFQYVNKAFCQLVGYTVEELYARTWQEITHSEDLEPDRALAFEVQAGKIPHYTLEKRYIRKDGSEVWALLFGSFVMDDGGQPALGVAVVIDITHRRQAEQALRESQQRLVLAKAAARLGTYDWDLRTGVIKWDERTRELLGVGPEEVVTYERFITAVHPDDRDSQQNVFAHARDPAAGGAHRTTYRLLSPAGETRWIEAIGQSYFEQGAAVRLLGMVQDVTDRLLSLERLKESEKRFRELANNIDQFAWTCDELGQGTWYNDRWYEYTGTTFEEMRGSGWQKVQHPEHLSRVAAGLRAALASGTAWEDTFPLRDRNGQYRWFLSRAVPIRDETGQVTRWFGTNTDITQQLSLQEQLQAADRRKDEFLALLAHELRNPVAPVRTAAEILVRLVPEGHPARGPIAVIQRQTGHLSRILDDLLDVARITQGKILLQRETVDLRGCVETALETAEWQIRANNQRLTLVHAAEPIYVNVDKVRLSLCIANLLSNAARYTEKGGEIQITCSHEQGLARIVVSDTGIGIAADFLPRVFELFSQFGRSLDRSEGGLGIGLFVCKEIIALHRGTISAASEGLGRGATFTIRLPVSQAPTVCSGPTTEVLSHGKRVLIVDDNRDAGDTLSDLLCMKGYDAKAVYSAQECLEIITTLDPHVIILDIGLPGLDGYELAARIKKTGHGARLIALSGYGQAQDKRRAALAGFDAHLIKPADLASLEAELVR